MNNKLLPRKSANGTEKTLKDRIFNLIITALAAAFVIMIAVFFSKLKDYERLYYISSSSSILNSLNTGSYDYAVDSVWKNRARGITDSQAEYAVPYALSDYYMAAFYETAYRATGNAAKADVLAVQKTDYRQKAGELGILADEMDKVFEPYK